MPDLDELERHEEILDRKEERLGKAHQRRMETEPKTPTWSSQPKTGSIGGSIGKVGQFTADHKWIVIGAIAAVILVVVYFFKGGSSGSSGPPSSTGAVTGTDNSGNVPPIEGPPGPAGPPGPQGPAGTPAPGNTGIPPVPPIKSIQPPTNTRPVILPRPVVSGPFQPATHTNLKPPKSKPTLSYVVPVVGNNAQRTESRLTALNAGPSTMHISTYFPQKLRPVAKPNKFIKPPTSAIQTAPSNKWFPFGPIDFPSGITGLFRAPTINKKPLFP